MPPFKSQTVPFVPFPFFMQILFLLITSHQYRNDPYHLFKPVFLFKEYCATYTQTSSKFLENDRVIVVMLFAPIATYRGIPRFRGSVSRNIPRFHTAR